MKQKFNFLIIFISLFFIACGDDRIDSSVISGGSNMSKEAKEIEQNLDKHSYADLADVFLDTKDIRFDKEVLIIFGKNNCKYCDMLKDIIKKDDELKAMIKDNFNPYYINISYSKIHNIDFMNKKAQLSTNNLASIFSASSTPTIVFLSKDGSVKYIYPGFSPKFDSLVKEVISKNSSMGSYEAIDSALKKL
ncbi:MAG: thioredoxin fold domain-containing protein [Helicobacteraceae bacterium]|nr:thioredoxin fold domain-containing protein [Helicobacteraceae bacterium]